VQGAAQVVLGQGAWGIWVGLASGVVANALLMNLRLARCLRLTM